MTTVYNSYEIMEAAFTGRTPAEIRAMNTGGAYTAASPPPSPTAAPPASPTNTPTHITNSYYAHDISMRINGGAQVSLIEVMQSMEIYEDIFSKSIHGFIEIADPVGGISKFMLTGGETITLVIRKPLPSTEIIIDRNDLVVHQISKVSIDEQNTMRYKLHFMPKSAINAQKKRLYRAFKKTRSIKDIVSTIYNEMSGGLSLFTRVNDIPVIQKNFLSPGYTPYEAIDNLTKRASYNGDYYVFFERLKKLRGGNHVFSSINNLKDLWEAETQLPSILYQPTITNVTPENANAILASRVQILENYDHINNMNSGFYNSRIRMLDILSRRFYDLNLNYSQIQDNAKASKFITNDNTFLAYDHDYPEYPGERLIVRPYNDVFANKSTWVRSDVYGSIMLSNIRVSIDIPGGNNLIGAGNLVNLNLPSFEYAALNLQATYATNDSVYAGKFFVTAVRHIFDLASYTKRIELNRDNGRINLGYTLNQLSNVPPAGVEYIDTSRLPPATPPPPPADPDPYQPFYDWSSTIDFGGGGY